MRALRWTLVLALTLAPAAVAAQSLEGVALGPDGNPLVGVTVVLHRVGGEGGAMVGADTTGTNGEFTLAFPPPDTAIYFAALRYEGGLYVGPAIQGSSLPVTDYVLEVRPSNEVGAAGSGLAGGGMSSVPAASPAPPPRRSNSDAGAVWLVALLALAAAAAFLYTAPRYRERRTRDALLEVAGIENRLADPDQDLSSEDRDRLQERRDRLKEQLAPRD